MTNVSWLPVADHKRIREFARQLRRNPTPAESILWDKLRRKALGPRTTRQKRLLGYLVDFYVPQWKLVIEVDGSAHENEFARDRDSRRTEELLRAGYKVIRFTNNDVLLDVAGVVRLIREIGCKIEERIGQHK